MWCTFSKAAIWQTQRQFYEKKGIEAWEKELPFFATSNTFLADRYASSIQAFMQNWAIAHPESTEPFQIIELGAGTGQFSYYLLQRLTGNFQYIMTDCVESNLLFWQQHPMLIPYLEKNILRCQYLDLLNSRNFFEKKLEKPLIIIANYVFDSIPCEIFRLQNGELFQVLVEEDFEKNTQDFQFQLQSISAPFDENPVFHEILEQYRQKYTDTYFLFPKLALEAFSQLAANSLQGALLWVADKAYVDEEALDYLEPPELFWHGGCFSMMVDYCAIAAFSKAALLSAPNSGLKLGVFSTKEAICAEISNALFPKKQISISQYLHLHQHLMEHMDTFDLEAFIAHLALSGFDPMVFQRMYQRLYSLLEGADLQSVNYLLNNAHQLEQQFYPLPTTADLYFDLAILFHSLKKYERALQYYALSERYFTPVFGVYFNQGVCYFHLGRYVDARQAFLKAQALKPEEEGAIRVWLERLI